MKKTFLALAAALVLAAPAWAATDDPQTQADKDGFTVEQVMSIGSGLQQLVKYESADKDGKPFTAFYDFSGDTRFAIAINLDIVRRTQSQLQNAYNDLVLKWQDPATGKVPENKQNSFNVETAKLSTAQSRAGMVHLKREDLKLDKNPIPGPVLSLIIPIIDR